MFFNDGIGVAEAAFFEFVFVVDNVLGEFAHDLMEVAANDVQSAFEFVLGLHVRVIAGEAGNDESKGRRRMFARGLSVDRLAANER